MTVRTRKPRLALLKINVDEYLMKYDDALKVMHLMEGAIKNENYLLDDDEIKLFAFPNISVKCLRSSMHIDWPNGEQPANLADLDLPTYLDAIGS